MKLAATAFIFALYVTSPLVRAQSYPSSGPTPEIDPHAAVEEHLSGRTAAGNPVEKKTADDFPAERRDVFAPMDQRPG